MVIDHLLAQLPLDLPRAWLPSPPPTAYLQLLVVLRLGVNAPEQPSGAAGKLEISFFRFGKRRSETGGYFCKQERTQPKAGRRRDAPLEQSYAHRPVSLSTAGIAGCFC